jgi:hypothetical protein
MVVAVGVFSMALAVLYAFGQQTTKSWERIRRDQRRVADLMVLDRALDTMLCATVPFLWPDPDAPIAGKEKLVFEGRSDSLLLTTLHRVGSDDADGAIRFVHLEVVDGELVARYAPRPFWYWRDVDHVSFQYADFAPDQEDDWNRRLEWVSEWDTDDEHPREEIPLAIMITVVWQDGRAESWLRRTAGEGYRERFGKWKPRTE